jgi:SAM-dependent methyltransferase
MTAHADMSVQYQHDVLPKATSDELARQEFVKSFKFHLATQVAPANRLAFDSRALPRHRQQGGAEPSDHCDVQQIMRDDPYFNFWGALQRNSQEQMWLATQLMVERDFTGLPVRAGEPLGTLELDASVKTPRYHTLVDIHCMPGGYQSEFAPEDASNGAVYDRAVHVYAMGRLGPLNADIGDSAAAYVKRAFPALHPKRILDLGCTVGHSTLPYADAFPDAEIYAIDVGAPVLRYAHARAEALGKKVHFSQQNAEHTNFPDGHFDLIVSHILVHETSHNAIRNIMREAYRLLAPGGVVLHVETPPFRDLDMFDAFMLDWDTRNNNEPYWHASHELVPAELAEQAGFGAAAAFEAVQPSAFGMAEAARTHVFQCGDFGGAGSWYIWGARKPGN